MRHPANFSETHIEHLGGSTSPKSGILGDDCTFGEDRFPFIPKESPSALEATMEGTAAPSPHYAGSDTPDLQPARTSQKHFGGFQPGKEHVVPTGQSHIHNVV